MEYAIQLLEKEKTMLERMVIEEDLMRKNMSKATRSLKNIGEIKRALKILKVKIRSLNT